MYRAVRTDPHDTLACKIIATDKLRFGWERELQKLGLLRGVPHIVQYNGHGTALDRNHRPFTYVLFNFIHGQNLREYIQTLGSPPDMSFIEALVRTMLEVLHALHAVGIQHGDLHPGNILISNPDPRLVGSPRTIWIADFGYGGSHNGLTPKDDYRQLAGVTYTLLQMLDPATLNARDRVMWHKIDEFLRVRVMELDSTQGHYVRNPEVLLQEFSSLAPAAERESARATDEDELREPGDYLWAEALGYRADEWRNLFVPEFLAAQDLLSRNITVLTGARGCGKTMAFRRLTVFMDRVIGEASGVRGADQFLGFYLNCRDLAEAFPWLPPKLSDRTAQQLIHYFHLAWLGEITKTISISNNSHPADVKWLEEFLERIYAAKYLRAPDGADILAHIRDFVEREKESCRLTQFNKMGGLQNWPLARLDLLDMLQSELEANISWASEKPLYFFLDDYTIPTVTRQVQRILNPIIFKRRSKIFFKISTEAANSFEPTGLNNKPLELHEDFELIDLATESLHQDSETKTRLLDRIFRPRIDRHPVYQGQNFGLDTVLGRAPLSNNALAQQLRESSSGAGRRRVTYSGVEAFVGMWASDIRVMIQMLVDMLREANGNLRSSQLTIDHELQDKILRSQGGEFLTFAESVNDPTLWERMSNSPKSGAESYGKHLREITQAFITVSRYELTKGDLVGNEGRLNPRQAFRVEITDQFDLPEDVQRYYLGLVRWHLFLQDWRGKSVRGMMTPRLYLNRILIPYAQLTFSSHDHITMSNLDFVELLRNPRSFDSYWRRKRERQKRLKTKGAVLPGIGDS